MDRSPAANICGGHCKGKKFQHLTRKLAVLKTLKEMGVSMEIEGQLMRPYIDWLISDFPQCSCVAGVQFSTIKDVCGYMIKYWGTAEVRALNTDGIELQALEGRHTTGECFHLIFQGGAFVNRALHPGSWGR